MILSVFNWLWFPELWFSDEYIQNFLLILGVWFVSTVISMIIRQIIRKKYYLRTLIYIIIAPGVIFHELTHLIACKLFWLKLDRVELFNTDTGSGLIESSEINDIGPIINIIISFSPLIMGTACISFLSSIISITFLSPLFLFVLLYIMISLICSTGLSPRDFMMILNSFHLDYGTIIRDLILFSIAMTIYLNFGPILIQNFGFDFIFHVFTLLGIIICIFSIWTGISKYVIKFCKIRRLNRIKRVIGF